MKKLFRSSMRLARSSLPLILLFTLTGIFVLFLPSEAIHGFASFWNEASVIFKIIKGLLLVLLILKWTEICTAICNWKGSPELAPTLIAKWPLVFSIVLIVELVGVWRDIH